MSILEVNDITKIFPDGTKALDGVNFSVKSGEAVIMLGHNGCGKSTLFKSIGGFIKPSSGNININGADITKLNYKQMRSIRKKVGMVFQNFNLIHNLSVFQNVLFGALGHTKFTFQTFGPIASNELRYKAMDCLERVGLSHLAKRRADQLSGGQKQRVAIARMLMQDPEIVLADEPIASLDPKAGREVMDLLWEVAHEKKLTVICVLHQIDFAKEYGKRIIALKKGRVSLDSDISDIDEQFFEELYQEETDDKVNIRLHEGGEDEGGKLIKSAQ